MIDSPQIILAETRAKHANEYAANIHFGRFGVCPACHLTNELPSRAVAIKYEQNPSR